MAHGTSHQDGIRQEWVGTHRAFEDPTSELRRPVDKVVLLLAKEEQSCPENEP